MKLSRYLYICLLSTILFSCKWQEDEDLFESETTVKTLDVSNSGTSYATISGNVSTGNKSTILEKGICWNTSENPTINNFKSTAGDGSGNYTCQLNNLSPNTLYYYRAYALDANTCYYGEQKSFKTKADSISITTNSVSNIDLSKAVCSGFVEANTEVAISEKGICWGLNSNPTIADNKYALGNGSGAFRTNISSLSMNTTYYVRAYAISSSGIFYGNEQTFTTLDGVTDIDGNVYHTTTIGTQTWMSENLKTTKLNDGTPLNEITNNSNWISQTQSAYCWYNNDAVTYSDLGIYYNWYAVVSDKVCPQGWHVPSSSDVSELLTYLGGSSSAGGKLKETGTSNWNYPNTGASNISGFNALPCNLRISSLGEFGALGISAYWWISELNSNGTPQCLSLNYYSESANIETQKAQSGINIRCLKNK